MDTARCVRARVCVCVCVCACVHVCVSCGKRPTIACARVNLCVQSRVSASCTAGVCQQLLLPECIPAVCGEGMVGDEVGSVLVICTVKSMGICTCYWALFR